MDEILQVNIEKMKHTYEKMYKAYKWSANGLILHFSAMIYTIYDKPFDREEFQRVQSYVKKNVGMFSHYRATEFYSIPTLLLTKYKDPEAAFSTLVEYEQKIKEHGLKGTGVYIGMAANILLNCCESGQAEERIAKSMTLYKQIKAHHPWLTSSEDIPFTVLMTGLSKDVEEIVHEMELYYEKLQEVGFKKSGGLQTLSHILMMGTSDMDIKSKNCKEVYDFFAQHKIKLYTSQYGLLGFFALLGESRIQASKDTLEAYQYLLGQKKYKYIGKQMCMLLAMSLATHQHIGLQKKLIGETVLGLTVEALIAAQQAAVMAAIYAASPS